MGGKFSWLAKLRKGKQPLDEVKDAPTARPSDEVKDLMKHQAMLYMALAGSHGWSSTKPRSGTPTSHRLVAIDTEVWGQPVTLRVEDSTVARERMAILVGLINLKDVSICQALEDFGVEIIDMDGNLVWPKGHLEQLAVLASEEL